MIEVKVTQIGNSLGIVLPKEALSRLRVEKGDRLFLQAEDGGYNLSALDPEVAKQMEMASGIVRRYRNALKKLDG